MWGGLFPGATVTHSDAPGPEGDDPAARPKGGVAVIAPQPFVHTATWILAAGYGISASFTHPELAEVIHVHNVYLPPDARADTAPLVCDALAAPEPCPGLHFVTGGLQRPSWGPPEPGRGGRERHPP